VFIEDFHWGLLPKHYVGQISGSPLVLLLALILFILVFSKLSSNLQRLIQANIFLLLIEFSPLFNFLFVKLFGNTIIELSGWTLFVFPGLQIIREVAAISWLMKNGGTEHLKFSLVFSTKFVNTLIFFLALLLLLFTFSPRLLVENVRNPLNPPIVESKRGEVEYLLSFADKDLSFVVSTSLATELVKLKSSLDLQIPSLLVDLTESNSIPQSYMNRDEISRREALLYLVAGRDYSRRAEIELRKLLINRSVLVCREGTLPEEYLRNFSPELLDSPLNLHMNCYLFRTLQEK
jgi:hypothetical protein